MFFKFTRLCLFFAQIFSSMLLSGFSVFLFQFFYSLCKQALDWEPGASDLDRARERSQSRACLLSLARVARLLAERLLGRLVLLQF